MDFIDLEDPYILLYLAPILLGIIYILASFFEITSLSDEADRFPSADRHYHFSRQCLVLVKTVVMGNGGCP